MVNLVFSSELLSQVKTAYRINSTHENGREKSRLIYEENGFLCSCKIKKPCIPTFKPNFFLKIEW